MARASKPNVMQTMAGETPGPRTLTPEERGFAGGDPRADWLEAETEIDTQLTEPAPR